MTDILKVFDSCIEDLENEIKKIESGEFDSELNSISSYAIKTKYDVIIGKYCTFPNPPSFNEVDDTGDDESVKTPSSERRAATRGKKRKSDLLESEEVYFLIIGSSLYIYRCRVMIPLTIQLLPLQVILLRPQELLQDDPLVRGDSTPLYCIKNSKRPEKSTVSIVDIRKVVVCD